MGIASIIFSGVMDSLLRACYKVNIGWHRAESQKGVTLRLFAVQALPAIKRKAASLQKLLC